MDCMCYMMYLSESNYNNPRWYDCEMIFEIIEIHVSSGKIRKYRKWITSYIMMHMLLQKIKYIDIE